MLYERKKMTFSKALYKKKRKKKGVYVCVYITVFFNGVASTTLKSPLLQTLSSALKVVL